MDQVVLPQLQPVAYDASDAVRNAATQMLADCALHCTSHHFTKIADILYKVCTNENFFFYAVFCGTL